MAKDTGIKAAREAVHPPGDHICVCSKCGKGIYCWDRRESAIPRNVLSAVALWWLRWQENKGNR